MSIHPFYVKNASLQVLLFASDTVEKEDYSHMKGRHSGLKFELVNHPHS